MSVNHLTAKKLPIIPFSICSISIKTKRLLFNNRTLSSFPQYISNNSQNLHFNVNSFYSYLIDSSTKLTHLVQIHAQLVVSGLYSNGFFWISKLINGSLRIGDIKYAHQLFDGIPEPNLFIWNAIICGYCKCGMFNEMGKMYGEMIWAGVKPNGVTLTKVLKGCSSNVGLFDVGKVVHGQIYRLGFESNLFVLNGVVSFYAKCGKVDYANIVFGLLSERTIVSWTAIISGFTQNGMAEEALRVFSEMRMENVKPDWVNLVSVLRSCTDLDYLDQGKSLHGCAIKTGFDYEEDLLISVTSMYAKCGQVIEARYLFDRMVTPNVILWNAMISGYAKNGYADEAIELFKEMMANNIKPDSITMRATTLACAQVGSLELAIWMNDYITRSGYRNDIFVKTAIIDMYAKCGSMDMAEQVFDGIRDKDVVVWSAMVMGYGLHGYGKEAIDLYKRMNHAGVRPNDITFLGLLTACKNSGLVKEGWDFFHGMKDHRIEPLHQHYACVVDLLGRAGFLGQAYKFITRMPIQPGLTVWGALLSACKIHRHVRLGEYAAKHLFLINPYDAGHYVQLSNLYAAARMWDHARQIRKLMKEKELSKDLGYSLIEINGKLSLFYMGDNSHPMSKEIMKELVDLERRLKEAGFVPDMESNLHDLSSEDMQENLCNHSERLAIAYGLLVTPSGSTLRITKNLRACVNCHSATKLISKITNREIFVRDANRFHHFKGGICSCGDYW